MDIRKLYTVVDETRREAGQGLERPITKAAALAIVANPLANKPGADVSELIKYGEELGRILSDRLLTVIPRERVHSFGKSAVIGYAGELEHAAALIHPAFGKHVREAIGGGVARILSTKKMGRPGMTVDVPLCYKDALRVVSHYDAMTLYLPDGPLPDEVVVILVFTDGGRPHPRTPGLKLEEVKGIDGVS